MNHIIVMQSYNAALAEQPKWHVLHYGEFKLLAAILFVAGSTLVVTSMWKLGVTGTYLGEYKSSQLQNTVLILPPIDLGDYFGILMNASLTRQHSSASL